MTLAAWFHDINPFLWRITETFGVRWYGVSYILGFVLAGFALHRMAKRGWILLPKERVFDALLILMFGVLLGGRLGFVLFYDASLLWDFSKDAPFWGVIHLTKGGMASHGGMIGVAVACWWISRGFPDAKGDRVGPMPMLHVYDLVALVAPLGLMLGRVANFINGELLGKVVAKPGEAGPWWSVQYPQEILSRHDSGASPEQVRRLEAIIERFARSDSMEVGARRVLEAVERWRGVEKERLVAELSPLISSRHPSQLYQALAEGPVLLLALWLIWWKPRRVGVVSAWFLMVYGVLRVVTEVWRLPDVGIERVLGLSRGQWLSVGMVVVGAVLLGAVVGTKWGRGLATLGGWGRARVGVVKPPPA